jgi:hypothetical protein
VVDGSSALGNAIGVLVQAGSNNTIGGTKASDRNDISGNTGDGIEIDGGKSNFVQGNYIGTDYTGTIALGNQQYGVQVNGGASGNLIGGPTRSAGNLVSGNYDGIVLAGNGTTGNLVEGNYVGTDYTGTTTIGADGNRLGNGWSGVVIGNFASGNTIGGTKTGDRNIISGNYADGVDINSFSNTVEGNTIGADVSGTVALGNDTGDVYGGGGVVLWGGAYSNTIGVHGAGNLISGNITSGIDINTGSFDNTIAGNSIGTDGKGNAALGNTGAGVFVERGAFNNTIGGIATGSGNSIAFNAKGVVIGNSTSDVETVGNSVLGNSIWDNTGLGIDLGDSGQTLPNGPNPRSFPNNGQNAPIITALTTNSVSGKLTSVPETLFRLEFFATPASGTPNQGQMFLGAFNVTTNVSGVASFTALVITIPPGMVITSTATDLITSDTSEFAPVGTQLLVTSNPIVPFSSVAQVVTLRAQMFLGNTPVASAKIDFTVGGLPGRVIGTTNGNGVVTVSFTVPAKTPAGLYSIVASFAGTEEIDAATGNGLLTSWF